MTGLARNVLYAGAGLLGSRVLGLAISVLVARALGVEEFGVYGLAIAYTSLWSVLMDGGSATLATREVARGQGDAVLGALFTLKPALILVAYAGLYLGGWLGGFRPLVQGTVLLVGIGAASGAYLALALAAFRGREEFGIESAHLLGERFLFAAGAAVALSAGAGLIGIATAFAASWTLVTLVAFRLLRRRHGVSWRFDLAVLGRQGTGLLKAAAPLFVADALTQVHVRNGPIILELAGATVGVGLYVAARRLIEALHLFPSAFGVALLPRLVSAWTESAVRGSDQMRVALRFMGTVALEALVAGWLWAEEIIGYVFGNAFAPSAGLLRILLGALVFMMLNSVLSVSLVARGEERLYATVLGVAAAVNLPVTLLLVRQLGPAAPAWASLMSEAVLFIGCLAMLRRSVRGFLPVAQWAWLLAGATVALGGLWLVKQASPVAALLLTVAVVGGGLEALSPIGFRDVIRQLAGDLERRRGRDL